MVASTSTVALAYALCGAVPLSLIPYVRRHRRKPGSTGLLLTILGLASWAFAAAVLTVTTGYAVDLAAAAALVLGVQLAAIGYFLIAADYVDWLDPSRPLYAALAVAVVAFQLAILTEPLHQLVWAGYGPGPGTDGQYGPLFVLHQVFGFGLACAGLALLSAEALSARGVRRRQAAVLVTAGVPPIAMAAVGSFVLTDVSYAISPFGFAVSTFLYAWALIRADFLQIVPVGRRRLVEEMDDAAITLDADGRVVDANAAARTLASVGDERTDDAGTGGPLEAFLPELADAMDAIGDIDDVDGAEVAVSHGDGTRHYHLNTSRFGADDGSAGHLLVLRDITGRKERERALEARERQLDLLRQVLARALRHNIRNDLTVVRGYAREIETDADDEAATLAAGIVEKCDGLVDLSNKAATIERLVTAGDTSRQVDLSTVLERIVARCRDRYPDVSVVLEGETDCVVETAAPVEVALENLIENAAEHNDGGDATATVSYACDDERATVTIEDDGPGIPAHEIEVLERGEETPLEHGSGLGLWIVYWIVEHTDCSVSFAPVEDGSRIDFTVPLATTDAATATESRVEAE